MYAGRTEVGEAGGVAAAVQSAVCLQQHVGGLQVGVHDAQGVNVGEALRHLLRRPQQRPLRAAGQWVIMERQGVEECLERSVATERLCR